MAYGTHQRDPISNEHWFFVEGKEKDRGAKLACIYLHLALTYFFTFEEIRMSEVEAAQEERANQTIEKLRRATEEAKRDAELMRKFDLPITELLAIWKRAQNGLLSVAEDFPEKRERIERFLVEQEAAMIARIERHAEKQPNA